jgi:hypothetical protein
LKITFRNLKNISESLEKGDETILIEYLNSFPGETIYHKFKNILRTWENDVSYDITLTLDGKNVKILMQYILDDMPPDIGGSFVVDSEITSIMDVPTRFSGGQEMVPIYDVLKKVSISGITLDMDKMEYLDKKSIIDSLPANIYNSLLVNIVKEKNKTIKFDNPALSKIRLNFLTIEPYIFLRGLFTPYGRDYFREVIFHLSKRIDGNILMDSTIQDIEFFIEKYNDELRNSHPENPTI